MADATQIAALQRLVKVAQGESGQCRYVRHFLLGLYNGSKWPFDMTELRGLDRAIQEDCLTVLRLDIMPCVKEIHQYIDNGGAIFKGFWRRERPEDFNDQ